MNPRGGAWTQTKPNLGPKPTWLGLESGQNPAWDLNPGGWDWNPVKTHDTWFQDLMKRRFLMSHCGKNWVRDKVVGKKWVYSDTERNTLRRQSVGHRWGWEQPWSLVWLVIIGRVVSHDNEWEDYSNYLWEGAEISRIWATAHSLVFTQCLGTVMAPPGVSFHLLIQDQGLVLSAILAPFDFNQFMLCPWAMSFFQKLCLAPFPLVTIFQKTLKDSSIFLNINPSVGIFF